MSFWARGSLSRVFSLSKCESSLFKSAQAFSTNLNPETSPENSGDENVTVRKPRHKKYVMLIGYHGERYYGVCVNPGQDNIPTVGKDICKALIKAGYLDDSILLSSKSLSQASRTDTGVSALKQIISLDLPDDVDLDKVRQYLTDDVKIYGLQHTIRSFVPFRFCSGRSYLYYIPSYVFSPHDVEMHPDYRLTSDTIDKIKGLLTKFVGRKNYHNFTKGRSFHDPRALRDITNVELLEPVIKDGFELACIRLKGKSFILNQIRKIIGSLVLAVRGYTPESYIDIALSQQGIMVSRAPPFGLMLEDMDFSWYNNRYSHHGVELIDFSKYENQVEALKDRILSSVVATEIEYERTKVWVESLQYIPFIPFSKEQAALDSCLEYDDDLCVVRSAFVPVSGNLAAALYI